MPATTLIRVEDAANEPPGAVWSFCEQPRVRPAKLLLHFMLDTSGSMDDPLHPREVTFTRYEALIQAVRAIAHVVLQECPDTVINVHAFNSAVHPAVVEHNLDTLIARLRTIKPAQSTNMFDALRVMADLSRPDIVNYVRTCDRVFHVLVTDGEATCGQLCDTPMLVEYMQQQLAAGQRDRTKPLGFWGCALSEDGDWRLVAGLATLREWCGDWYLARRTESQDVAGLAEDAASAVLSFMNHAVVRIPGTLRDVLVDPHNGTNVWVDNVPSVPNGTVVIDSDDHRDFVRVMELADRTMRSLVHGFIDPEFKRVIEQMPADCAALAGWPDRRETYAHVLRTLKQTLLLFRRVPLSGSFLLPHGRATVADDDDDDEATDGLVPPHEELPPLDANARVVSIRRMASIQPLPDTGAGAAVTRALSVPPLLEVGQGRKT